MSTYSAAITLTAGELTTTRPHPAPQAVDELVDSLLYTVREGGSTITSVAVQIDTADTDTAQPAPQPLPPVSSSDGAPAADPLST